jgi:hypothetical protein
MYARYPATLHGKPPRDRRPGLHSAGEVSTLFIAHRHSISNRRHRGYIGAFFRPTSEDVLLDWGQPLCQRVIAGLLNKVGFEGELVGGISWNLWRRYG